METSLCIHSFIYLFETWKPPNKGVTIQLLYMLHLFPNRISDKNNNNNTVSSLRSTLNMIPSISLHISQHLPRAFTLFSFNIIFITLQWHLLWLSPTMCRVLLVVSLFFKNFFTPYPQISSVFIHWNYFFYFLFFLPFIVFFLVFPQGL